MEINANDKEEAKRSTNTVKKEGKESNYTNQKDNFITEKNKNIVYSKCNNKSNSLKISINTPSYNYSKFLSEEISITKSSISQAGSKNDNLISGKDMYGSKSKKSKIGNKNSIG